MRMTANEAADWHAHMQTPVLFNHHTPIEINETEIQYVNLNGIDSTVDAVRNKERVLIVTPVKDATTHLSSHFDLLVQLTYPHELIDLAFLVGDSTDDTLATLAMELERVQTNPDVAFRSTMIVQKDFGVKLSQDVKERHKFENQGPRRKAMAKARNYLLSTALKPDHSWVYWRDIDIVDSPKTIIEDFVVHDRDVLVPNIWFHRYETRHGEVFDIEGRCKFPRYLPSSECPLTTRQSTTTPGKNPPRVSPLPPRSPNPSSSPKATSNSPRIANIWPSRATGGRATRTRKCPSMASAESTSSSKQMFTARESIFRLMRLRTKRRRRDLRRWPNARGIMCMDCRIMWFGTWTRKRSPGMLHR
jgi:hypothetical protein